MLGKVVHDTVLSPSINRTRVHGCLCGVSVCVGLVFRRWIRQNVRIDFRMAGAAARVPTALRASTFPSIAYLVGSTLVEVPRSQGRGYGGGQIDVVFLPPGP